MKTEFMHLQSIVTRSDHNTLVLNIKTNWKTSIEDKGGSLEIYNYKKKIKIKMTLNILSKKQNKTKT